MRNSPLNFSTGVTPVLLLTLICVIIETPVAVVGKRRDDGSAIVADNTTSYIQLQFPNNPQAILYLDNAHNSGTVRLTRKEHSNYKFRIFLHLVSCNYDKNDYIEISWPNATKVLWSCSSFDPYHNVTHSEINVISVLDNIKDVNIKLRLEDDTIDPAKISKSAILVANIYQDKSHNSGNKCRNGMTSCNIERYENDCSQTCRSRSAQFEELVCEQQNCRCIPSELTCNGLPNCGWNNFEENDDVCRPMETCHCGRLGGISILVICSSWLVFLGVSGWVYWCVRESASLLATFDIVTSLLTLVMWNLGGHLFTVPDCQPSMLIGSILLCINMVFAIWLYVGNRQAQRLSTAVTISLIYLTVNTFLLFVYLVAGILYFGLSAHLFTHEDFRLWISAGGSGCRLTCLYSVLHYIKSIHKRRSRARSE